MLLSFEDVGSLFIYAALGLLGYVLLIAYFQFFSSFMRKRKSRSNMAQLERVYQRALIEKLKKLYPGCWIMKNDEQYRQGTPDLTILHNTEWAILESKRATPTRASDYEPNQEHYLRQLNNMSFARMSCPENESEVLADLDYHFGLADRRPTRVSRGR